MVHGCWRTSVSVGCRACMRVAWRWRHQAVDCRLTAKYETGRWRQILGSRGYLRGGCVTCRASELGCEERGRWRKAADYWFASRGCSVVLGGYC